MPGHAWAWCSLVSRPSLTLGLDPLPPSAPGPGQGIKALPLPLWEKHLKNSRCRSMGFPGGSVVKNPLAGDACCGRGHSCADDMQARSGWMHKTDLGSTFKPCDLGLATLGFQPPPPPPSRRPDILPFGPVSTCILGSQLVPCTRSSEAEPRGSQLGCTLYHQESLEKSPLSRLHPRPAPSGRAGAGGRTEALVFFFKFPRLANTRLALRPRDLGSLGGNGYDPVGGEGCKSRHVPCGLSSSVFGL